MRPSRIKSKRETSDDESSCSEDDKRAIRRTSWNDEEVFSLLEIYSSSEITESFQINKYKVFLVWRTISNKLLHGRNILKTAVQCQDKINALKRTYYKKRKSNDKTWIFWSILDKILSKNQLIPSPPVTTNIKSSSDGNGSTEDYEDCVVSNYEKEEEEVWTNDESQLFLNILLLPDNQERLLNNDGNEDYWRKISGSLKLVNVNKHHTQCRAQISKLKNTYEKYKKLMENGLTPKWFLWQLVDSLFSPENVNNENYWTEEESKTLLNVYCEIISNQNINKSDHVLLWNQIYAGMEDLGIYKNSEQCEKRVTLLKKQYLINKKNGSSLTKWTYWEEFRKISEIWQRRVKISKEESFIPSETPALPPSLIKENILENIDSIPLQLPDINPEPIQFNEKSPDSPNSSPVQQSKRIKLTNNSYCEKLVQTDEEQQTYKKSLVNGENNEILERLKRIEETNLLFFKRMEERDNQILNVLNNISVSCQKIAESLNK